MDELDVKILSLLSRNSRLSNESIAEVVGLTGNGVAKRIEGMRRAGILESFLTFPNFSSMGLSVVLSYFRPKRRRVSPEVPNFPFLYFSVNSLDGALFLGTLTRTPSEAEEQVEQLRRALGDYELYRYFYSNPRAEVKLTPIQITLLLSLIDEPRARIASLARRIGVKTRRLNRVLERMVSQGLVRFSCLLQLNRISGCIPYYIFVNLERGEEMAEILNSISPVIWLVPFESKRMIAAVCRRNFAEVERDVRSVESFTSLEEYMVMFPGETRVNQSAVKESISRSNAELEDRERRDLLT
jgi:DNA-binding Lrp family transcriptional regulator